MNETNYQISLLTAKNNRLEKNESMYRLICNITDHAYIYYNYAEKRNVPVGNWSHFFTFPIEEYKSISQIVECAEDKYKNDLFACLSLDNEKKEHAVVQFKTHEKGIWIELDATVRYDETGTAIEKIFCFKDITKFVMQNDELAYMAYYDSLTGLFNRNYFIIRLREFMEQAKSEGTIVSVLFMDIDDFRKINDGMGMLIGDEVVQLFGQTLRDFQSDKMIISHFNSDIFCAAIKDPMGSWSVENVIRNIKEKLSEPYRLSNGAELSLTISVGVAEYPEASEDALELINCAEIVMFKAKRMGKNEVCYFDTPTISEFKNNINIEQKMSQALKEESFFMCYQPQYTTEGKKLRGVEALVRWKDDEGKMISPGTFIPIAEKNGSILSLGEWILDKTLHDFKVWYDKHKMKDFILSINISALQFKSKNFVNNLIRILDKYDIPCEMIELEITESIFIDDMRDIVAKMNVLREMGIRFSMDDFGTGFSSLSYLRKLPIDTLKIDKSFIDTLVTDGTTKTIAESIINLSKNLGFDTIAEGVEEESQFHMLKNIGCENIQGFYLGKPMDSDQIDRLLAQQD